MATPGDYLDHHNVYALFSHLLAKLVACQPDDPIAYLIRTLEEPTDELRVVLCVQPGIPHADLTQELAETFRLVSLTEEDLPAKDGQADSGVCDALCGKLQSVHDRCGWLLVNLPHTKAQVEAMQLKAWHPNRIIVVSAAASVGSDPRAQELVARHDLRVAALSAAFPKVTHSVTVSGARAAWAARVHAVVQRVPITAIPRQPLRLFLLGPYGSGKGTLAARLAFKHKVVHVSVGRLLREEVAAGSALGGQCKAFQSGQPVPDELALRLITARLLQSDCQRFGWVLDGFPTTPAQVEALRQHHVVPNRVVVLRVDDAVCVERTVHRRVDPVTGEVYVSPPGAIAERVVQRPSDHEDAVKAALAHFRAHVANVQKAFGDLVLELDGAQPVDDVFDALDHFCSVPLGARLQLQPQRSPPTRARTDVSCP